jgi:hypothetical protein
VPVIKTLVRVESVHQMSLYPGGNVAEKNISKTGKVAIALAVVAGVLSFSRAIYNFAQHGELDIIKIALGIGIPCLMYAIVKSASPEK